MPADSAEGAVGAGLPRRYGGLCLGVAACGLMLLLPPPGGMEPVAWRTAAVATLMAVWWISEAIPLYATALLPIVLLPTLDVLPLTQATAAYANPLIFLFLGGFLIALTLEKWGLHRRIALNLLRLTGTGARALVGGFMLSAALLSMWVSNTATAIMMLPIAISVIGLLGTRAPAAGDDFARALLLAVAYGASIGGVATLIGTPPNALLAAYFDATYGVTIGFAQWMAGALPLSLAMLWLGWLVLTRVAFRVPGLAISGADEILRDELRALGPMSRGEWTAAVAFVLVASLWIAQPALASLLSGAMLSDTEIALAVALLLFIVPVDAKRGVFALDWATAQRLPWGVLILFGGGLSLAGGIQASGLADWIGGALAGLGGWPTWALLLCVAAAIVFLTELTSNTATTAAMLPVLASAAVGIGENPLLLAVPAALAASCAFMLPVATPPNAIVFGAGRLAAMDMARAGFWLNVVAVALVVAFALVALPLIFDVEVGQTPEWAGSHG